MLVCVKYCLIIFELVTHFQRFIYISPWCTCRSPSCCFLCPLPDSAAGGLWLSKPISAQFDSGTLFSPGLYFIGLFQAGPQSPKFDLPKIKVVILLFPAAFYHTPLQDTGLHLLMVTAAKVAPRLLITHQYFIICKYQVQQSTSPHHLLDHLCQEVVISVPTTTLPRVICPLIINFKLSSGS